MKLIDLTRPLDPRDIDLLPDFMAGRHQTMVPDIEYQRPGHEGAEVMCSLFGCTKHDLPDGEGWGAERLHINTHLGTHVDAPLHYGSHCEGKPSRTITDISLDELFVDGMVLDLRGKTEPLKEITVDALKQALADNGGSVIPGSAIMLRTGQEQYSLSDPGFFQYPGMSREGTLFLASTGAKILGTDCLGWDVPFAQIKKNFQETGDGSKIWEGHFAGRTSEVFIIQQMHELGQLPPNGFKVGFFPLRLARCSASPARVVAFVE
jgi:kynurenine formamidase